MADIHHNAEEEDETGSLNDESAEKPKGPS